MLKATLDQLLSTSGMLLQAQIHIFVKSQDGNQVQFKVLPATLLHKVFDAYASRMSAQLDDLRFVYRGYRLDGHDDVQHYGIEDQDIVDVVVHQVGD